MIICHSFLCVHWNNHGFFWISEKTSWSKQAWNIRLKYLQIEFPQSFIMRMLTMSYAWALFGFILFMMFTMLSSVKAKLDKHLSTRRWESVGILLLSLINEHWLAKKELKGLIFCLKSVLNLSWWNIGEMQGTFLPVKKLFRID